MITTKKHSSECESLWEPLSLVVSPPPVCTDSVRQSDTIWSQRSGSGHFRTPDTSRCRARLGSATDPDRRCCQWSERSQSFSTQGAGGGKRGRGGTQMVTRFCSWWWHSDQRERLSRCTCRCSFRRARSLLGGLRSSRVGSSIRCHSSRHCSEAKH